MGLWHKFKDIFSGSNILYYPGCLTHFALPEIEENYKILLNKIGIDFIFLPEFNCCGSPVKNAGYKDDFSVLIQKNLDFLKKYGIGKIITNCPACYQVLKNDYGLEVEHISKVILQNLDKLSIKDALKIDGNRITYHDPCHLGRLGDIFDEPRDIIRHLGFEIHELPSNRMKSLCCGAGGGLRNNNPNMANDIAKSRLGMLKTNAMVTPCPMCYMHFRDSADGREIYEFSQVLLGNFKKQKDYEPEKSQDDTA